RTQRRLGARVSIARQQRHRDRRRSLSRAARAAEKFPARRRIRDQLRPDTLHPRVDEGCDAHARRGVAARGAGRHHLPANVALVLCAVFVPTAFITGITGQFYRQFALTIAVSTVISAFNSLTLSPAMCALLLPEHHAPKDRFTRVLDAVFGWFFRGFNKVFK